MIPYGRQSISEADVEAVVATLRSDWLTQGPAIDRFEKKVAAYCGAAHGVAVSNGTAALHLACLAAGLGPGDICWTTPNSFVASANAALYCGASVDFVDIDSRTYNIDPATLQTRLEAAAKVGRLPKVLIPVHFSGQSCRMDIIARLASRYGFTIIEDACHAIGGTFHGTRIGGGSGGASAMTVFSFHPVKIVTTAEGGMVMTNDPALNRRLRQLRSHGITREADELEHNEDEPWYYEQQNLGFNYRITDIQAALGSSQMDRIETFVARRAELVSLYDVLLKDLPVTRPHRDPDLTSAHHLYVIQLDPARGATRPRREIFKGLRARGIGVNVHYIPIPAQPYYRRLGFTPEHYPQALAYYRNAITLPLFPEMTSSDVERVVGALKTELA